MGNPAGRRVSRPAPWMARGGGPRIQACVRAHRAQARCRVVGQEPFGYFGALFQSDPPSGGTLSGRYRSNGYVHKPTVLTVRPPSQASQLPHLDRGVPGAEASAGRPPSQASQPPHLQRGASGRSRLSAAPFNRRRASEHQHRAVGRTPPQQSVPPDQCRA